VAAKTKSRLFVQGERLKIKKKSHVVDKERAHEELTPEEKVPIEYDVTGAECEVDGAPYSSPGKDGEICTPVRMQDGSLIGVPEDRLERVSNTPAREVDEDRMPNSSGVSKETVEFWREYFKFKGEIKETSKSRR